MILIDRQMPESCDTCPCMYDFIHCTALRDDAEESLSACDDYTIRQKWCPIKEVVQCKDCKHWSAETICGYRVCEKHSRPQIFATMGNWFCADGERMK